MKIELQLSQKTVAIQIKTGLFQELSCWIPKVYEGRRIFVLTDENLDRLYGEELMEQLHQGEFRAVKMVVPAGEASKSLAMAESIYSCLLEEGFTRNDLILILGGGVVGDLGGFVAATYLRGVRYVQIPTSLLAQVDSSIGGKVAVNLKEGKNLCGSFYHPEAVWIDPALLKTLPAQEFRSGMGEVIKYGCIGDEKLFSLVEEYVSDNSMDFSKLKEIIGRCVVQKVDVVASDEKEGGKRKILNFGHTLGHAIEKNLGYGNISHGEAVAMGMAHITRRAQNMGQTCQGTVERLDSLLQKTGLRSEIPKQLAANDLLAAIFYDKKMSGDKISIILLKKIGHAFIKEISRDDIIKYIERGSHGE
ncbi:3-dehydroquinate synthase [Clostridia bacterium]|nr:3-dehydroquinate synthase [Clostridia bacterium]